jgi:putative SOS response-associated peptidase YedK
MFPNVELGSTSAFDGHPRTVVDVGVGSIIRRHLFSASSPNMCINATVEKLTEAASWRGPWKRGQRCILPALGFYEWQVLADGKNKQPYYITLNDQDIFGFAGLWDSSIGADGIKIESCTIVTMPANRLMTEIHNVKHRMPAILAKKDRDAWLSATPEEAFTAINQYTDTHMVATPVSKRVNTPKNNDAELIAPILAA